MCFQFVFRYERFLTDGAGEGFLTRVNTNMQLLLPASNESLRAIIARKWSLTGVYFRVNIEFRLRRKRFGARRTG